MKLSVVIPTLNEEKYLPRCLESLNRQAHGSFEVVLGDAGSQDRTHGVAEEYGARVVVEPKPTIAAGRQKACDAARGKTIVSTDADVIAPPHWLETIERDLRGNAWVHGNVIPYDGNRFEAMAAKHFLSRWFLLTAALNAPTPAGANLAFTRRAFKNAGGWNTDLVTGEDVDIVKRLKAQGSFAYSPEATVFVSLRRLQDWGYARFIAFHATNAVRLHALGRAHGSYAPVR
jgi:glycosyltransferase involved in cell wall biosynthesis